MIENILCCFAYSIVLSSCNFLIHFNSILYQMFFNSIIYVIFDHFVMYISNHGMWNYDEYYIQLILVVSAKFSFSVWYYIVLVFM